MRLPSEKYSNIYICIKDWADGVAFEERDYTFAAPTADAEAEAQYLAYGHGLVGGVYAAAPVVPKVTVQKHTSTHTTHHVINHAPVIYAFSGVVPVAGVPVVAAVLAELYGPFQLLLLSTTASLG